MRGSAVSFTLFWGVALAVSVIIVSYEVISQINANRDAFADFSKNREVQAAFLFYLGSQLSRAARLQILILEFDRKSSSVLGLYCWGALIGALLPYKSGDLAKAFFLGKHLGNYWRGTMLVVVERFLDALSLLVIWAGLWFSGALNSAVPFLCISLLSFCSLVFVWHQGGAETVSFVRKLVLQTSTSIRGVRALGFALYAESAHSEFQALLKGRWLPLIICTLAAWAFELAVLQSLLSSDTSLAHAANTLLTLLEYSLFPAGLENPNEIPAHYYVVMMMVLVVPGAMYAYTELRSWLASIKGLSGGRPRVAGSSRFSL